MYLVNSVTLLKFRYVMISESWSLYSNNSKYKIIRYVAETIDIKLSDNINKQNTIIWEDSGIPSIELLSKLKINQKINFLGISGSSLHFFN